jgi:xylulokinase
MRLPMLELPLERMACEEGSAYGAALLAGVRAGVFAGASEAVERCVRSRETIEPVWDYSQQYACFKTLYPTLCSLRDG